MEPLDDYACLVRLRNGEHWLTRKDGWNHGEELEMFGPLTLGKVEEVIYRRQNPALSIWFVNADQVMGYAKHLTPELMQVAYALNWKVDRRG